MPTACEGLIIRARSGFFDVETDDGGLIRCRLRGRLLEEASATDVAAIGDRVRIEPVDEAEGVILAVAERRSTLARAARTEGKRGAGEATREQVIVANADQALFVFAAASPEPSLRLLDRFLVAGESAGIETICIVVNKLDLVTPEQVQERFQEYERMGYPVLATSALGGAGVEALRKTLDGRLSVFTGPSGVGKTSLLNVIQPGLGRMVKAVSRRRRGGHPHYARQRTGAPGPRHMARRHAGHSLAEPVGHRAGGAGRLVCGHCAAGRGLSLRQLRASR